MERLTERNENNLAMAACCGKACEYNYVCEVGGCGECRGMDDIIDRLADFEDILGDDYDLNRLKVITNQCMTMREEVSQRFSLTANIPIDRLKELVESDQDGRVVVLPVKEGTTVYHINFYPFGDCPPEIFDAPFHITDYYNIGNTVFLTEEAAEAALEGEKDGNNHNQ